MTVRRSALSRRNLLKGLAACAAASAVGVPTLLRQRVARSQDSNGKKAKFLIVLGGFGGASIIDSCLAIREGECATPQDINCFPDSEVINIPGSPLRGVNISRDSIGALPVPFTAKQTDFLTKHRDDIMVVTGTGTSVNHVVAQKRSITGNNAWNGRTLQEMVALEYGENLALPNVNMASLGFLEHGDDRSLPGYVYAEPVAQPAIWPLSLDGVRGIKDAPDRELVEMARALRNDKLDEQSQFYRTFELSERLQLWKQQRGGQQTAIEASDLITSLNMITDRPGIPLTEYGLGSAEDAAALQAVFPYYFTDPLEGQAALAYLLIKNRVSSAVTIAPTFNLVIAGPEVVNPPLAFDYSHSSHRAAQAVMWKRTFGLADRLIDLLKSQEFDSTTGESFWDRTLIYIDTDFGRTKRRVNGADQFGTSHDLNNGYVIISPMVRGNTVLGGVDPNTGLTYGFDPLTGAPDVNRTMSEGEIYSGILQVLDVQTTGSGLPAMPAMRKNG